MNRVDERSIREKIEDLAREEYEKLKSESTNFKELEEKLKRTARHVGYDAPNGAVYTSLLGQEFEKIFKEDTGRLSCK